MKSSITSLSLLIALCTVSCFSTHKPLTNSPAPAASKLSLLGTEWVLADLNGTPPLPNVQATLSFLETG